MISKCCKADIIKNYHFSDRGRLICEKCDQDTEEACTNEADHLCKECEGLPHGREPLDLEALKEAAKKVKIDEPFFTIEELRKVAKDSDVDYRINYLMGLNATLLQEIEELKEILKAMINNE